MCEGLVLSWSPYSLYWCPLDYNITFQPDGNRWPVSKHFGSAAAAGEHCFFFSFPVMWTSWGEAFWKDPAVMYPCRTVAQPQHLQPPSLLPSLSLSASPCKRIQELMPGNLRGALSLGEKRLCQLTARRRLTLVSPCTCLLSAWRNATKPIQTNNNKKSW